MTASSPFSAPHATRTGDLARALRDGGGRRRSAQIADSQGGYLAGLVVNGGSERPWHPARDAVPAGLCRCDA